MADQTLLVAQLAWNNERAALETSVANLQVERAGLERLVQALNARLVSDQAERVAERQRAVEQLVAVQAERERAAEQLVAAQAERIAERNERHRFMGIIESLVAPLETMAHGLAHIPGPDLKVRLMNHPTPAARQHGICVLVKEEEDHRRVRLMIGQQQYVQQMSRKKIEADGYRMEKPLTKVGNGVALRNNHKNNMTTNVRPINVFAPQLCIP